MATKKRKTSRSEAEGGRRRSRPYAAALGVAGGGIAEVLTSPAFRRAAVEFVHNGGLSETESDKADRGEQDGRKKKRKRATNPTGKELERLVARELVTHSAPLRFTNKEWDKLVCCFLYCVYHKLKQSKLGGKLFFDKGKPFKVTKKNVKVKGRVIRVDGYQNDGDYCFDIVEIEESSEGPDETEKRLGDLHCEITPCDRDSLSGFIATLDGMKAAINAGTKEPEVELAGDRATDPAHTDPTTGQWYAGGPEIHPVRGAWFLP